MARVDKELEAHVYPATQEDVEAPHCCKVANRVTRRVIPEIHAGSSPLNLEPQVERYVSAVRSMMVRGRVPAMLSHSLKSKFLRSAGECGDTKGGAM